MAKKSSLKLCGICGESITSYEVIDNMCLCKDCEKKYRKETEIEIKSDMMKNISAKRYGKDKK